MSRIRLFIGCYTKSDSASGVKIFDFDTKSFEFTEIGEIATANASFLHIRDQYLFAVNEGDTEEDTISSYDISTHHHARFVDRISSFGAAPCFISCDVSLNHLFIANYNGGNLAVISIDKHGKFLKLQQNIRLESSGSRKSHMHAAVLSNDEKYLVATNLGADTVTVYPYCSAESKPLDERSAFVYQLKEGTGPRHLIFSNDNRYLYVVGELDASIHVFEWDSGRLSIIQSEGLMPDDYQLQNSAADLHFTPDGNYLYVSNRGDANQLIKFEVDKSTGLLKICRRYDSLGRGPRNFCIDASGQFLFVAHQYTNDVIVLRENEGRTGVTCISRVSIETPVFVKIFSQA